MRNLAPFRGRPGVQVTTSRGPLQAGAVFVATNAYTGAESPGLRRRVVPVGSYQIATAPLGPDLADRLVPRGRMISDTLHLLHCFRRSPDDRLVFGGRAAFTNEGLKPIIETLTADIIHVFPELAQVPIDFDWGGKVTIPWRQLPHAARMGPVHYALGYCGHGVAMATYLGDWIGLMMLGRRPPPLASLPFPAVPLYRGRPWFLPLVGAWYQIADGWGGRGRRAWWATSSPKSNRPEGRAGDPHIQQRSAD